MSKNKSSQIEQENANLSHDQQELDTNQFSSVMQKHSSKRKNDRTKEEDILNNSIP